jgi:transposase
MAMSKRSGGEKQEDIWIAHTELAVAPGHPFYKRLNELLEGAGFDEFVEGLCARFYHARLGRPSLRPGIYFRGLLVGYFEGIDSERGIAWRVADSLALRRFLLIGLDERTPDHSTISRTRRLIDIDTHGARTGSGTWFVSEGDQLYLLPVRGCETPESVKMKSGLVVLALDRSARVQPGDGTG